jgi:hypothetical protein
MKEKIGDYSYEAGSVPMGSDGQPLYVTQAMFFLKAHMHRSRVSVI